MYSGHIPSHLDFVRNKYLELAEELDLKTDTRDFERIIHRFQRGGKIDISREYTTFSHPSYSEALRFILSDKDGIPTKINTQFLIDYCSI